MAKPKSKEKIAKEYIHPHIYYNYYDCSDSMHNCELLEAQWEAVTGGDTESLEKFIQKKYKEEYIEAMDEIISEDERDEDMREQLLFWFTDK